MWRMEASSNGAPLFEAFLDATDLFQGRHPIDVAPYDKPACRAVAAAVPLFGAALSQRPRVARFLEWFTGNSRHLQ